MAGNQQKWGVRKDIYRAIGDGAPPPPPSQGVPEWINAATEASSRGRGKPYEIGDPDVDAYNRQRHMGGAPEDDPFASAYQDPREFQRIISGAYQAGATGDRGPEEILNGPYSQTPLGRLMKRAYEQGKASRGGR